jgi:hypothetical protein
MAQRELDAEANAKAKAKAKAKAASTEPRGSATQRPRGFWKWYSLLRLMSKSWREPGCWR